MLSTQECERRTHGMQTCSKIWSLLVLLGTCNVNMVGQRTTTEHLFDVIGQAMCEGGHVGSMKAGRWAVMPYLFCLAGRTVYIRQCNVS
jgi:hypothetical protein